MHQVVSTITDEERLELAQAKRHLEHPSLAARLTGVVGTPIEIALKLMPKRWYDRMHAVAEAGIRKALDSAISSLRRAPDTAADDIFYKALGLGTGAVGGFFGMPGLVVELPVTTTVMLRSIADIARSEGEHLDSAETRLACMEVFALGGRTEEDDAADTGYYGLRLALAIPVSNAARYVAEKGFTHEGGPAMVSLVAGIAARFGVPVTHKYAAQTVPLIGAAAGGVINLIFIQHFQEMARAHFTVRRLERRYGNDLVKREYESIA